MPETIKIIRPVKGVMNVVLASFGNLVINQGDENRLIIETTKKIEKILVCKQEGSTLNLEIEKSDCWVCRFIGLFDGSKNNYLTYYLTLKNINEIISEGSGNITSRGSITSKDLKLQLKGSGDIDLKIINALNINLISLGSGNFSAKTVKVGNQLKYKLEGKGDIKSGVINAQNIELFSTGSGDIKIDDLITNLLDSKLIGTGDVELYGTAESQYLSASGSGDFSSKKLKTNTAVIKQTGSGDIYLNVKKSISINAVGSGNIKVKGKPSIKSEKISGSGSLKYINKNKAK